MAKKKKAQTVPRRLNGEHKPLMVRGTRIYRVPDVHPLEAESAGFTDAVNWVAPFAKALQRGEIILFRGMMARQSRRGRWAWQSEDGIWNEVRFLDEIPWPEG